MIEAKFYESEDDIVVCNLCPHHCRIQDGKTGICDVRKNQDGKLISLNYSEITAFGLDPIEKKPLFHFKPGEEILSLGTWGCNLSCPFCQNFEISKTSPQEKKIIQPFEIVGLMKKYKVNGVAYTYSEPVVWYEYVLETSKLVKQENEKNYNVMITNGFIEKEPLKELLPYIDAFNIDLKTFDEKIYKKELKGELENIKNNIEFLYKQGKHVEITTLIVPGISNDLKLLENEFKFISSVSQKIPLHLSRYFPRYKYDQMPTDIGIMKEFYHLAKKYLDHVYLGNVWNKNYESTYCSKCGETLIERSGYNIKFKNLDKNGGCIKCGLKEIEI
ncbi:AmmeMemoRadiSam system radical SAM enzyme [Geotoga petraea]|jgi:pyruvate formate lyase activating enzyme|uniref:AmmeMemoRadiSam system radical SAM enzyme n=1 Tax=Geotoga petraea TaxID=28234 RepID=A0A1G6N082_9BACT|nr:AmmeMemoRadiSam system radical SAM enzyme [Geotoga petraea]MDK2945912.1 pyruvate formate lyase activating enzyme [Geotoga sp.]TGG87289.1 AmmeMemoRadiSam system radical SAM enzyme [Geotoga petraea]SDC60847.1 pyruvate formate lyase activating enzyme [Geotoga petraea]